MRKSDVKRYKAIKGMGQIGFDLILVGAMKALDISFNSRGMMIYQTSKGLAYLLWDLLIFDKEIKEQEQEQDNQDKPELKEY